MCQTCLYIRMFFLRQIGITINPLPCPFNCKTDTFYKLNVIWMAVCSAQKLVHYSGLYNGVHFAGGMDETLETLGSCCPWSSFIMSDVSSSLKRIRNMLFCRDCETINVGQVHWELWKSLLSGTPILGSFVLQQCSAVAVTR